DSVRPISGNTVNKALGLLGYGSGAFTSHSFRSSFSTAANEAGWPADVIERQLAHVPRDRVRAAYNHASRLVERRALMNWWAGAVDALRAGATAVPARPA